MATRACVQHDGTSWGYAIRRHTNRVIFQRGPFASVDAALADLDEIQNARVVVLPRKPPKKGSKP